MATDEEKEDEKHERVALALENTIVLQGMGLICAVARYIGIQAEELHDMFNTVSGVVDTVIEEAETHECSKPNLTVVRDKKHEH
jgi:hypothetical protein